jgi:signal transduction histidine kinase
MIGISQKLMLGFGGLLAVVVALGLLTMNQINELGRAIDVILKENYRSVVACQEMKESLERVDRGILFTLIRDEALGTKLIEENIPKFNAALEVEINNITLVGERAAAERIRTLFNSLTNVLPHVTDPLRTIEARRMDYGTQVQPLFQEIKDASQEVLLMNQANMDEANNAARRLARAAYRRMLSAIFVFALLAVLFSYLAHRWVLHPINRLIESTNEIRRGNLDLVLKTGSRDEIGRLSESFNEMAAALRQVRNTDKVNMIRTRRATEEVFNALPAAIAVLNLEGKVEFSTATADHHFGLKPGVLASDLEYDWLMPLLQKALDSEGIAQHEITGESFQRFIDNREHFFQPMAVPISMGPEGREPAGMTLLLKDVTQLHEQQELKRGVLSTVSHQMKTPLTSLRMSIYLLLEERIGELNEKQTDLLIAARDESDRLVGILDDLLDLSRIESGKAQMNLEPISPHVLSGEAIEPLLVEAKDKGLTISNAVPSDLPEVWADREKVYQVFANLLSNALRFTRAGGSITVGATQEDDHVAFSVEDTGSGIAAEHLRHVFEPFYRVPGQDAKSGIGLGLAIVKEIVCAHGGEVGVESEVGMGSTFRFTLPLGDASAALTPKSGEEG